MADCYTMGVDIGSAASKCLILKNGSEIIGQSVVAAGTGTSGPLRAVLGALAACGLQAEQVCRCVATGYGRNTFEGADYRMSELSCHALGAHTAAAAAGLAVRTVIDIGGQDAKVLRVGAGGRLENFVMNDKCAAGTGRFLDVMARILELDISEMGALDAKAEHVCGISSTCTVFAESEVISHLANNVNISDLIAGIHASVAVRTASLARRLGVVPPLMMTGGVAKNSGVVRALERELDAKLFVPDMCQLIGAYGAAIFAWQKD